MADNSTSNPLNTWNPFGDLSSATGAGLSIYDSNRAYQGLQSALNTIGPTQLQGWGLNGPGGMSTGYNPTSGQGNIGLGALDPAYGNFAGAAGAGAGGYNASLPYQLSGVAGSTLNPALSTLGSAYGNYGAGINAANSQLPTASGANFGNTLGNLFSQYQAQLAPGIQQQAYGLQNTLFGNGVANSSGAASGSLAEQNFGRGVGQATANAYTQAFQGALGQQNSAASNYGTLSNSANGILNNALGNFGNTTQLISGLNTAGLTNAGTAAQGAGALNTLGLNNYNASLQTGLAQSTARNQSLFPYASVASALAQQPTAAGMAGNFLARAGANGGDPVSNLLRMLSGQGGGGGGGNPLATILGGIKGIFSGGNGGNGNPMDPSNWNNSSYSGVNPDGTLAQDPNNPYFYNPSSDPNNALNQYANSTPNFGFDSGSPALADNSGGYVPPDSSAVNPSAAGGEAANGMTASGMQSYQQPSDVAGYSASAPSGPTFGQQLGTAAGAAGNALSIYQGLNRGGLTGYGSAALNSANLANNAYKLANNGTPLIGGQLGGALGAAGGALGLYTGLKQGGVAGYTNAALGAANTLAGIGTLAGGTAAGGLGSLAMLGAYAGPLGLALAPVLFGMSQPPYTLNSDFYKRQDANITAGLAQGATATQKMNAWQSLGGSLNSGGAKSLSSDQWNLLSQYGVTPQNYTQFMGQLQNAAFTGTGPGAGERGTGGAGGKGGSLRPV